MIVNTYFIVERQEVNGDWKIAAETPALGGFATAEDARASKHVLDRKEIFVPRRIVKVTEEVVEGVI